MKYAVYLNSRFIGWVYAENEEQARNVAIAEQQLVEKDGELEVMADEVRA